ncbi:MAG: hypothetical protein JW860_07505 [Sedimentisphaerales bacterium]|nr:hypothetical protein [Sedimentisphaerales bacterium]
MNIFNNPEVIEYLEMYLNSFEEGTGYTISDMRPEHRRFWTMKQLVLSFRIFDRVCVLIDNRCNYEMARSRELKFMVKKLSELAFPFFVAGMDVNPIHHHMQTVENMFWIVTEDKPGYEELRKALVVALLHDIGSGLVAPGLKKLKSSDIKDRCEQFQKENRPQEEIDEEIQKLIEVATQYRKAHMQEGGKVARQLLGDINKIDETPLARDDTEEMVCCIENHDNPSVAEYYCVVGRKFARERLIPLENKLAYALREADRLWMVSKEGLESDLFDDLKKGKKPDPLSKLRHNIKRFKEEYRLYEKAEGIKEDELRGFKEETLFRTKSGFALYRQYVRNRLGELFPETNENEIQDRIREMEKM